MKKWISAFFILLPAIGNPLAAWAQGSPPPVSKTERTEVVTSLASALEKKYVFPETAKAMAELILQNLRSGAYDSVIDPYQLAEQLTSDLREISRDRHLGVSYNPERIRAQKTEDEKIKREFEEYRRRFDRTNNYGFREVKLLPGNIGYLRFDQFNPAQEALRVAVGAMAFLANCDALIIDLRQNGGGSPEMIQLLASYLFPEEPQHLNSFYYRENQKTEQFWTLPYVPGDRLPNVDVYLLTSGRTFSGAEELVYDLKNLKRATIVGETTGGGAHPVRMEILNDNFAVGIPYARAVNPVSKTNWEGTGIEPDVRIAADHALAAAEVLALEKLVAGEKDGRFRTGYRWSLENLKAVLSPTTADQAVLKTYVGNYGARVITYENGNLYYRRNDGPAAKMVPLSADVFALEDTSEIRLTFVKQGESITGLEARYSDGRTDFSKRTE